MAPIHFRLLSIFFIPFIIFEKTYLPCKSPLSSSSYKSKFFVPYSPVGRYLIICYRFSALCSISSQSAFSLCRVSLNILPPRYFIAGTFSKTSDIFFKYRITLAHRNSFFFVFGIGSPTLISHLLNLKKLIPHTPPIISSTRFFAAADHTSGAALSYL